MISKLRCPQRPYQASSSGRKRKVLISVEWFLGMPVYAAVSYSILLGNIQMSSGSETIFGHLDCPRKL